MSVPCWTFRYEAMGYESATDAMIATDPAENERLAVAAGYDTSEAAYNRDHGAYWLWEVFGDMCRLDEGHAGPHQYIRQDQERIVFLPEARPS